MSYFKDGDKDKSYRKEIIKRKIFVGVDKY